MIWITGGGTGGHMFPALHIAEELRARHPDLSVHFIGSKRGQEAQLWPERGLRHSLLPVAGNLRGGPWERLQFYSRLGWSLGRCERLFRRQRPRFVLGTGGYASYPAAQVAAWHGVRLFWQEQNAFPGQVTRRLGAKCEWIFTGFPDMEAQLPGAKVLFTGNPVRSDVATGNRWRGREAGGFARNDLVLLVLGGSGGAASINRAVARIADVLANKGNLRIWWQTGRREFEYWRTQIAQELFPGTICAFIDGMADAYAAADIVLARAGAMTTAEICAAGKPAVLVPFPYAAADHQTRNVELFVSAQAALRVNDSELEGEKLAETLLTLASDRTQQAKLAAAARRLGRPRATAEIVDVLEDYL